MVNNLMGKWLVILACSPALAWANTQSTPLRTYASSPFQSSSLSTQLRSGFAPQQTELFSMLSAASVWAQSDDFQLDYYQNQAHLGMQWRVSDRLSAEVMYQYSWAGNNHIDTLTIGFHDFFNIGQNGRLDVDKHSFDIRSDTYGIEVTDFEGETLVNALHGYMQYQLFENQNHALALGGSLYYNSVNDSPFETSVFEQGVQLNYSFINGNHAVFTTVGFTHRDDNLLMNIIPVDSGSTAAFAIGYNYRFFERHEVVIEYHGFEGVLDDGSEFEKRSHEVVTGYRYHGDGIAFELLATENAIHMDNSTDIMFTTGLRFYL
ncbi:DUF3187 family protein [Vibrio intestinalis]|uniref:DUF3187 family protein n=1 Tax=Vibrio intestinalis TaxID=2933291 RepID=UPI0021A5C38F|nr:DUF3187 family protein [Vibrio intestinalis]